MSDADRGPWLERIAVVLQSHLTDQRSLILACSALKRCYRDRLRRANPELRIVCLNAPKRLLEARAGSRREHYMPAGLVADQCAQLQLLGSDEDALLLDATLPPGALVSSVRVWLAGREPETGRL